MLRSRVHINFARAARAVLLPALCAALWVGAGSATAVAAPAASAPRYVDLADYPTEYAQWAAYQDLRRRLQSNFDNVCGDTYCEGEFSDIQALRFRCAVAVATGTVSHCGWAFAASDLDVDPASGEIQGRQPVWLCRLPVPAGIPVERFFAAMAGDRPLFRVLPGATSTFHEALGECLH